MGLFLIHIIMLFLSTWQYQERGGYIKVLSALTSKKGREKLERQTGGDIYEGLLLGDFARTDVQARIANEIIERTDINYVMGKHIWQHGQNYYLDLSGLQQQVTFHLKMNGENLKHLPTLIWPWVISPLANWFATRIYGLGGEAMLNFGLPGLFYCLDDFWCFCRMVKKET